MSLQTHIVQRASGALPLAVDSQGRLVYTNKSGIHHPFKIEPHEESAFESYKRARNVAFDPNSYVLKHNCAVEMPLMRLSLSPYFTREIDYKFRDTAGNTVEIGKGSASFGFAHFDSAAYIAFAEHMERRFGERPYTRDVTTLFYQPLTATFTAKGRKPPSVETAEGRIRACLFKLAVEQNMAFELYRPRSSNAALHATAVKEDWSIPKSSYEGNAVAYYKIAKSSPFPSQSFLAYYHVLEYFFLTIAEDKLQQRLRALISDTTFSPSTSIDKVIAAVRGADARSDEKEMLQNVLDRFVDEDELTEFIRDIELRCGEKIYTKRRSAFGENIDINLSKGHTIANAARTIKHIRNAIVHSSDRYKRDERHLPLTDSEDVVEQFIPLVRFFAEKVIFGTAR